MNRILKFIGFALFALAVIAAAQTPETHYVSKNGDNSDGKSWATAWTDMDRIQWGIVRPGDTILIDGGAVACPVLGDEVPGCGQIYNRQLSIGQNNVTIRGVGGTVIIDGNQTNFTYCSENGVVSPPRSPNGPVLETVVSFGGRSGVTIENIHVRNGKTYGINFGGGDNNSVKNVSVHNINNPADTTNNSVGITMGHTADNIRITRAEIYRNGQDAIRGTADNLTVEDSYIHDHYCNHPDGIQAFVPTSNGDVGTSEQVIENMVIQRNVFERVGLQQVFLGENATHQSWVNGLVIRDNLFIGCSYCIKTKHQNSTNFVIEHNTFYGSSQFAIEWCCGAGFGARAPMVIRNNIFHNTRNPSGTGFYLPTSGTTTFSGNCLSGRVGGRVGNITESGNVTGNVLFSNVSGGNYALSPVSPCAGKGSSITSKDMLFVQTATPTPTFTVEPTATETLVPSETPTETPEPTATEAPTFTPSPVVVILDCRVTLSNGVPVAIECP